ncbi:MAG TPA: DinB family protein [Candidatus Acidoferrales bacterium]|jgi:DinB family protein|nr:DinB family protein [Candidatus Acidoferrales bacterium]
MSADIPLITTMFQTNASLFDKATEGIREDQWLATPGNASNHLTWIAGHVVIHRAKIPRLLGQEWSAPWEDLFSRGSKLVAAGEYPQPPEIRRAWNEVSQTLSVGLSAASPEILARPVPKGTPTLDGTVGGTIGLLCLHETYHIGQLGYLRKLLGYGQTIG